MLIKDAVQVILEQEEMTRTELAVELDITPGMLSHYTNHSHHPRLGLAAKIWGKYRVQVEPYTVLALDTEYERQTDG